MEFEHRESGPSIPGLAYEHHIVDLHEVFTVPREFLESLLVARGRARPLVIALPRSQVIAASLETLKKPSNRPVNCSQS